MHHQASSRRQSTSESSADLPKPGQIHQRQGSIRCWPKSPSKSIKWHPAIVPAEAHHVKFWSIRKIAVINAIHVKPIEKQQTKQSIND